MTDPTQDRAANADALARQAMSEADGATDEGMMLHALVIAVLSLREELRYLGDTSYGAAKGLANV